jgi:hypothetical protein
MGSRDNSSQEHDYEITSNSNKVIDNNIYDQLRITFTVSHAHQQIEIKIKYTQISQKSKTNHRLHRDSARRKKLYEQLYQIIHL